MKLTDRVNHWIHPLMLQYIRHQYVKKLNVNRRKHPDFFLRAYDAARKKHKELWSPLIKTVNTDWLDMFYGISGVADPRFVPEDVFYGVIERCLNNCDSSGAFVEDKNDVCFYVPTQYLPNCIARYDRGVWFDGDFNPIDVQKATVLLKDYGQAMVGKPSMGSCGGTNVRIWDAGNIDLAYVEKCFEGYVFQEILKQDAAVSSFNPSSVNTCRIMTFRRPWDGHTSAIAGMLRLGCADGIADNLALGGVSVDIAEDGSLAGYGVDHDFGKFLTHPISNKAFEGFVIPHYGEMCEVACAVARHVPGYNLLSFDMIAREEGTPCVIEINATSMTLAQLQTVRPLFGDETEQVIEWCAAHRNMDKFNHFRTWY